MSDTDEREWKVLVVEDDRQERELFRKFLEQRGISVCMAANAEQVEKEMSECLIGMVVMDVLLGGTRSGLTIGQDLRKKDPYLPILFISADPKQIEHLCEDERLWKNENDFRRRLIIHARDQMGRYIARNEARSTARIVRSLAPRIESLERARTVDSEILKAHAEMHKTYQRFTGRALIAKQMVAGFISVVMPIFGVIWYITKDIAAETVTESIHSLKQIAPMRAEQADMRRMLDRLEKERQQRETGR